jgi:hypothetical protein
MVVACGSDSKPVVDPQTDDFTLSDAEQKELDDAAAEGEGAEGSYSYDEGAMSLTITLVESSFDCGPVGTLVATVESLSATTLVLRFGDDDSPVAWTRMDEGEGLAGVWKTNAPTLYLILGNDGSAQIFGEAMTCDEGDRPRNEDQCYLTEAPPVAISIDGDLSDWDSLGAAAAKSDPAGDQQGSDPGADVLSTKLAYNDGVVYVYTQLAGAPSTAFQNSGAPNGGVYQFVMNGYNGLSVEATVFYVPATETWEMMSFTNGVEFAVGDDGIEWAVDISSYLGEGFGGVDFIMVQPRECNGCDTLDDVDCLFFEF